MYLGPPDVLVTDAGTSFTSAEFQQNCNALNIKCKVVPIESPDSMSPVERYHKPLRLDLSQD